jgi:sigma-B regulation protein RsbU (phosphoserine phosphatase)
MTERLYLKMNFRIKHNIKLQIFFLFSAALFVFKLFFYDKKNFMLHFINEVLAIGVILFLILYISDLFLEKKFSPMSLVMNLGIMNVIIFIAITFSDSFMPVLIGQVSDALREHGIMYNIISFVYVLIIAAIAAFVFLIFKELYFFGQKRSSSVYYNTMVIFILLASFSTVLDNPDFSYIKKTFLIISIILIGFNSLRISWMAFITKKEKLYLLLLSVIICTIFIVNLINISDTNSHYQVFQDFSSSLAVFFKVILIYGAIYFGVLFFTTLFHIPTAEAFDRKAQEVSSLQYFSKLITQVLDFDELAETVTDIAKKVSHADAAWIVWIEGNNLKSVAHENIGYVDSEMITEYIFSKDSVKNKLSGEMTNPVTITLSDFRKRTELSEPYSVAVIAPLKAHNQLKGYLVSIKKEDFIFDDEDKSAINTFSDYASVAIENSRLLEESIEKERLEKELDVAREIQKKILPSKDPVFDKLDISSVFIPAFEVGGDYYDFFDIDQNKFGFIIADVSGKGISAAFIMAEVKGIFESLSKTIESPKEILIKANQILKRTLDRKNFVSAAYGLIDFENEILSIARAGHCPLLLIREGNVENIRPMGLGLGLNFGGQFEKSLEEIKIDLKENDLIVLYTDGITEAKNKEMEDFGESKFEQILLDYSDKSVDEISNEVIKEVTQFSKHNTQHDDITLVILKWKPRKIRDDQKFKIMETQDGRI